tara:strand:+ start:393 stop:605 length:213 start_codon:yes stop_codon:yes gene_type:complete
MFDVTGLIIIKINIPQKKEIKDIKEIILTFEYPKTFNVNNSLLFLIEIKNHIAETNIIKGIKFIKIKFGM